MSIPRYMIVTYPDPDGHCGTTEEQPWDAGRFVLYADHLADREALLAVLRDLLSAIDNEFGGNRGHSEHVESARSKARAAIAVAKAKLEEEP